MARIAALFAVVALVPAMTGPVAAERGREAFIALCGGGVVSIPLDRAPVPDDANSPCCAKGCHSSRSRKRIDRAQ